LTKGGKDEKWGGERKGEEKKQVGGRGVKLRCDWQKGGRGPHQKDNQKKGERDHARTDKKLTGVEQQGLCYARSVRDTAQKTHEGGGKLKESRFWNWGKSKKKKREKITWFIAVNGHRVKTKNIARKRQTEKERRRTRFGERESGKKPPSEKLGIKS